jgi:hypothetical protein
VRLFAIPDRVTVGREHVTITTVADPDALTACTCGHRCTNDARCAAWAHANHARQHRGRGGNGGRS